MRERERERWCAVRREEELHSEASKLFEAKAKYRTISNGPGHTFISSAVVRYYGEEF